MMTKTLLLSTVVCLFISGVSFADTFADGTANEFTIDFISISGDASSANGTNISQFSPEDDRYKTFTDPGNYRMGTYEITNDQWNKFKNEYGTVTGSEPYAYDQDPYWPGSNVPTNSVSWYEAAQFVNWLNTSTGHQAAYKFSGTQGTSDYTLRLWQSGDIGYDASNPFRNSNAYYFLPTEDEWVKAAYWNGTNLQTWATVGDVAPTQDGWNFYDNGYATAYHGPWDVGDGAEELNGTFNMMGNASEWMESPYFSGEYLSASYRGVRGGSYYWGVGDLRLSFRSFCNSAYWGASLGFRVASVPEPTSLVMLGIGGLVLRRRKR